MKIIDTITRIGKDRKAPVFDLRYK